MNPFRKMISCLQRSVVILLLTMPPASIPVALAQDYPSRPIALIVPLTAGGGADTLGRILAERMKGTLGQPIVIENIPTASGTVGVGRLAQAAPDGYTIGIGYQTTN
jgi:tripartite-type tricarboxylate transporter receptor subunit TctC